MTTKISGVETRRLIPYLGVLALSLLLPSLSFAAEADPEASTAADEPDEWETVELGSAADDPGDEGVAYGIDDGLGDLEAEVVEEIETPDDPEPTSLPSGFSGKSGVTPQSLALPDGEGSLGGMGESFTPNLNSGTGTFSVPIALPPGRRGLQPQIGLGYTTGAGDGPLGWGWSLGAPSITRQSDKGLPRYDATDRFIYNGGQELVPIADLAHPIPEAAQEEWPVGWEPSSSQDIIYYRARFESGFMRFFYNRTADTWLVQDRQGNHYYFGEESSEKVIGPGGTYQWSLSRLADARRAAGAGGNDVLYRYTADGNNLYLTDLYWNSYEQQYGRGHEAQYQHNAHLEWEERPDRSASYAAGFRVEQNLRLRAIRVSSYQSAPSGDRPLTRIYLFNYYPSSTSFHSRLEHLQVCGRGWDGEYGVHSDTSQCLPPLTFGYSETEDLSGASDPISGFGYLNNKVTAFVHSPDVSTEDPNVDLLDVNQDGLPDIFVTKPDYGGFGNDHAVILNDGEDFAAGVAPHRIDNPAGWSLNLENMNVQVLDMDGTGNADLLHMPYSSEYHYYRLVENGLEDDEETPRWRWDETPAIPLNDAIDFTDDALNIRLLDLNNDHLIDIVRSTGTRMEYFFNLSADPEFLGQFGRFDAETGQPIPNEPVTGCLLYRGSTIQLSDPGIQFADMNGDGVQDLVDLKSGSIAYWPGRGWGRFGDTEEECAEGEIVDGTEIEMEGSPWFSNPDGEGTLVADVNGDGLSDLVQIRFDAVDVWLNKDGETFTARHVIDDTPFVNSGHYGRVRLADMNGSGTVDIVWADAGGWKYLDLGGDYRHRDLELEVDNGGLPAGLLEQVDNGVGATTWMQYASTTELMVAARELEDNPWRTVAPMPMAVIRKVVTRNYLDLIGGQQGRFVQEFVYRDPFYDAAEAEFKGFGYAESWDRERDADGDGTWDQAELCSAEQVAQGGAPMVSRNWFHRGVRPECMEAPLRSDGSADPTWPSAWGPKTEACLDKLHDDNPLLALQGASIMSDTYSPCTTGKVVVATVSEIGFDELFDSIDAEPYGDDRSVWLAVPNQGRAYKYDPNQPQSAGTGPDEYSSYPAVSLSAIGYPNIRNLYRAVAPVGAFHMVYGSTTTNDHGYPTEAFYGGFKRYSGAPLYAFANCDQYTERYTVAYDPSTWVHTVTHSDMIGATAEDPGAGSCADVTQCTVSKPCNTLDKAYNAYGDLESSSIGAAWDYDGTTEIPGFMAVKRAYNQFGQVVQEWAGCDATGESCQRHTENVYTSAEDPDTHYSAYIRKEIVYVPDAAVTQFVFEARWDAGLAQIVYTKGADGAEGAVAYDSLGRFYQAFGPRLDTGALCTAAPTKWVEYVYGTEASPMSALVTHVNTSQARCGDDPWAEEGMGTGNASRWEELYTFVDSLGKPYAQIAPGDKHLGGSAAFPWVINGKAFLNGKGGAWKSCEGRPITGPTLNAAQIVAWVDGNPTPKNCSTREHDSYGRPIWSIVPDGTPEGVRSKAEYRIDEGDSWDHLDLYGDSPCGDYGTYSTQRVDGLGRTVATVARHRDDECNLVERWTTAKLDAVGGPKLVTTYDVIGSTPSNHYTRRAMYDSLGRLRVNRDLNFGQWVYEYDFLGQLIGATSPTGDESEYDYDMAGRLVRERAGGVEVARYYYDAYPGDDALFGVGNPPPTGWLDTYPGYAKPSGRLVAVVDPSGASVTAADYGSVSESWRYAAPDLARTYTSRAVSDYAGQLVVAEDPDGHRATADYYTDGTPKSTFWSNTSNPQQYKIVAESLSNMFGQTEWVKYGDAANTQSWTGYNQYTHQPLATTVQQIWTEGSTADNKTLLAFGYQYDKVGKLAGVADWRGRPNDSAHETSLQTTGQLLAPHPTEVVGESEGAHVWSLPGSFDGNMAAPSFFGMGPEDLDVGANGTLWPKGAVPSDAVFGYDTLYQLRAEDREYASQTREDGAWDPAANQYLGGKRAEALDWEFDPRGSMQRWQEDEGGAAPQAGWGRALGGTVVNGWQLNGAACNNWYATNTAPPAAGTCYLPDAMYFAHNIGDVPAGRATCTWAEYDAGGRLINMWRRTACSACAYDPADQDKGATDATCADVPTGIGAIGTLGYQPPLDTLFTHYTYSWNALGQLEAASRWEDGLQKIVMTYVYDAAGARVIREKSDIPGGLENIRQDVYLGGYERRQVQFQNDLGQARSINAPDGVTFADIDGTRLVKYSSGARMQWKSTGSPLDLESAPQIFLTFSNHLGSTSAVVDYANGNLVEWKTNYAYGADESEWQSSDAQYDNADEPYGFTGKEEDVEVGLHYFGARYYSSYTARWLGPDPPVVHGGGMSNHFGYGANSPYIYVDPDGNNPIGAIIGAVIGAVIGGIAGGVQAANNGDNVFGGVIWGAYKGASIGAAGGAAGPWAAAGAATAFNQAEMAWKRGGSSRRLMMTFGLIGAAISGGDIGMTQGFALIGAVAGNATSPEFHKASAITFGSSVVSGYVGAGINAGISNPAGSAIAGWGGSLAVTYAAAGITGTLTEDNADDLFLSSSASYWGSYAGSAVGGEIANVGGESELKGIADDPADVSFAEGDASGQSQGGPSWTEEGLYAELNAIGAGGLLEDHLAEGRRIFSFEMNYSERVCSASGEIIDVVPQPNIMGMRDTRNNDIYLRADLTDQEAAAVFMHEWTHTQGGDEVEAWAATIYAMKRLELEKLGNVVADDGLLPGGGIDYGAIKKALGESKSLAYDKDPDNPVKRGLSRPFGIHRMYQDWGK